MFIRTRRRFLRDLAAGTFALPGITSFEMHVGQSSIPRIGFLSGAGLAELETAFITELEKLGFSEGKDVIIEKRMARANTSDGSVFAEELARMDLVLIVVAALPFAIEVRKANPAMPMVIGTCPGMVSNGFAKSLEQPGGIYTGMDELPPGVTAKRLQLLKTADPTVTQVALISTTPGNGGHETQLSEAEKAASALGIKVKAYRAKSLSELKKILTDLVIDDMNGMLNFQGGLSLANRKLMVDFAVENNIPAIYQATLFAEAGGLMTWAPDLVGQFRESAHYVAKILKGAKPGDLPIQHPAKYFLTVNLIAARKINLTLPQDLLTQASRILP